MEIKISKTEVVTSVRRVPYTVLTVSSESNPEKTYRVDVVNQRCSCPGWKFQRSPRQPCKHLRALGFQPAVQAQKPKPVQIKIAYDDVPFGAMEPEAVL